MNTQTDNTLATQARANTVAINAHVDVNTFRPYDSALGVPDIKGYRTVKLIYRENKKTGEKAGETSYIRVPEHITEQTVQERLSEFMPYFVGFLESKEDELIKELHKAGAKGTTPDNLNLDAILAHLASTATSQRMNAERIAEWFKDNMADMLALAFAEKMGYSEDPTEAELDKLANIVGVYSKKLESLASPKTVYRPEEAEMLQKALEVTSAKETTVGARFYARLEQMKSATPDNLLMGL